MTDRHIHILQHLARRARRDLDEHPDPDGGEAAASISRRDSLRRAAQRTGQQVTAAKQRRRPGSTSDAVPRRAPE
jgi:hypothetical protein